MATEHRFDPFAEEPLPERRHRSWLTTCLIGCAVIVVAGIVLAAVLAYWISQNWREWMSEAGTEVIVESVNASDLPEQEKREIEIQVNRVGNAVRDGSLSMERLGTIVEQLMDSPILSTIVVSTAENMYLEPSGLSDEEKAEARITLQRFVRGAIDGTIDQTSVDSALDHIADRQEGGGWQLRDRVTDAELRGFLAVAKARADEANVPDEPEEFDPSDEIKRIIDEAMGGQAAEEPLEAEAPPAETPLDAPE
jgi:hypothetical protein